MPSNNAAPVSAEGVGASAVPSKGAQDVAAGFINAILILIVLFFVLGSLWLEVFAIPAFFVFFRAAVVTIASVRQGINQFQSVLEVMRPLSFQSMRLGGACGLVLTLIAGGATIFVLELFKFFVIDGDTEEMFVGIFKILGSVLFTHMAFSIMKQGSYNTRSMIYFQSKIDANKSEAVNGPERSTLFYLGLGASLREGLESYLYMLPLGGAYESKLIPIPAFLGLLAGILAARYLVTYVTWGAAEEGATIQADSHAKNWAIRREKLTDQYVSKLAAEASTRRGEDGVVSEAGTREGSDAHVGNLSGLSAIALQNLFKDSNVDPEKFDDMDYAQKRLVLLRSSKALMISDGESDSSGEQPGIMAIQRSSQWGSFSEHGSAELPEIMPDLVSTTNSGSGQTNMFHRRGPSLLSIAEDEDGYLDRGGYSYDGAEYPVHPNQHGLPPLHPGTHTRGRSALRRNNSLRSKASHNGSSVRFQDDAMDPDDETRSVMASFQHRYLTQAGARNPSTELEVMETTLTKSVSAGRRRRESSVRSDNFSHLAPGSPMMSAPRAPVHGSRRSFNEESMELGGNMALGSNMGSSRKWRKSSRRVADEGHADPNIVPAENRFAMLADIDDESKSFFATVCLAFSAFVIFASCAGLMKMGVLGIKDIFNGIDDDGTLFNICDCCTPNSDGSVTETFFAMIEAQFGYSCAETVVGLLAWVLYWLYPILVMMFTMRMCCFSSIPVKDVPMMAMAPSRKQGSAAMTGFSAKSTRRFQSGLAPDPSRIRYHPTHVWIKLSAVLNLVFGATYIWWRAVRSMPDNPTSPLWNWLFFSGECILVLGVWTSHLQRAFPAIRDLCTMDDLVEIDQSVSNEATVCIMVPTAGEKMKNVKHVLLGAYSQRLWPTMLHTSRQLRIAVLDEKGRHEVHDLVEKIYRLAEVLVIPAVQLELSSKFGEEYITPRVFMDYFNQMDALDKFVFSKECHPAFDVALKIENLAGMGAKRLVRENSSVPMRNGKVSKPKKADRLEQGFKKLFDTTNTIPSLIYSARKSPGTPKVSPKAGNMNAAIFADAPGEEPVVGSAARIVVVNDARHRLKTEFLQRTVPYFFRLNRQTRKNYSWSNVGFVQTPQRFEDLGDGDPLANHAVLTFFVANVSKDGVGGVTSCGQGSLWRTDALRGMAADGRQTVDSSANPDAIGHDCGFRAEVLIEDTHTSLEFFKQQWRSAFVCEPGETLAVCVEQPNTVQWRVKQVFRWHIGAVQLLLKDGIAFMCTSKMPTILHKMFGLDSLTYYIQAVGGTFILLLPIMFSIFQETPFTTRDLEFIYFFFPYILTATIPTLLALGWKNVNPNRALADEQFWLSTCYVQVWAFTLGVWNRITCANPDNAWNLKCPVWPLGLLFFAMIMSAVNTTAYWAYTDFDSDGQWIFLASIGASIVGMFSIWPMFKLWWPGWVALPSAYHQKFILILIFIAVSSILATYL